MRTKKLRFYAIAAFVVFLIFSAASILQHGDVVIAQFHTFINQMMSEIVSLAVLFLIVFGLFRLFFIGYRRK